MPFAVTGAVTCWNFIAKCAHRARATLGAAAGSSMSSARAHEIEQRGLARPSVGAGAQRDRPFDVAPVVSETLVGDVGAVHRKAGDHFRERLANAVECEIARMAVACAMRASWLATTFSSEASERRSTMC